VLAVHLAALAGLTVLTSGLTGLTVVLATLTVLAVLTSGLAGLAILTFCLTTLAILAHILTGHCHFLTSIPVCEIFCVFQMAGIFKRTIFSGTPPPPKLNLNRIALPQIRAE
jgi:hypothetical protein